MILILFCWSIVVPHCREKMHLLSFKIIWMWIVMIVLVNLIWDGKFYGFFSLIFTWILLCWTLGWWGIILYSCGNRESFHFFQRVASTQRMYIVSSLSIWILRYSTYIVKSWCFSMRILLILKVRILHNPIQSIILLR